MAVLERTKDGVIFTDAKGNKTEVKIDELPEQIVQKLAVYGLYTKLSKSRAGKEDPDASVYSTIEALKAGKWTVSSKNVPPNVRAVFNSLMAMAQSLDKKAPTYKQTVKALISSNKKLLMKLPDELKVELAGAFELSKDELDKMLK